MGKTLMKIEKQVNEEGGLTLINVFPFEPQKQQQLLDILKRAVQQTMRYQPGFLSAHLYRGIEGTYVANYVKWRSLEDFRRMWPKSAVQQHIAEIHEVTQGNPQLYELCDITTGVEEDSMLRAEHDIEIARPWQDCFALCSTLDRWPKFMPAVRQARIVRQGNEDQEIELTAEFGDQVLTWRSRRELRPDLGTIRFWNLTPRHPIATFGGEWLFEQVEPDKTRIRVLHKFELADPAQEETVRKGISRNMVGDLKGMKAYLENNL
jgi:ribosome-associated toxin RatA of RatAB toxin-antitoxin module/heme-degrading monooxygenase HmoA